MWRKLRTDSAYNGTVSFLLLLASFLFFGLAYLALTKETAAVVRGLETTPIVRVGAERQPWSVHFKARGLLLYAQCQTDTLCRSTLTYNPTPVVSLGLGGLGLSSLILGMTLSSLLIRRKEKLDVGRFLDSMDTHEHEDLVRYTTTSDHNPLLFTFGAPVLVNEVLRPNGDTHLNYNYANRLDIGLPDKELNEHFIVDGGTGNGKTSSVLLRILLGVALQRQAAVVPDVKYGEDDGGLIMAVKLFHNLGLPVFALTCFEQDSIRIPIFDRIHSIDDGRKVSRVLFPIDDPQSAQAYYLEAEQSFIAAILYYVAQSTSPNMKEVLRIVHYQRDEMKSFAENLSPRFADVRQMLLGIVNDQKMQYGGLRQGMLNGLDPFNDPRVVRAFTSKEGQNLDIERVLTDGGLIYVGNPKHELRGGRAQKVFRIIDNYVITEILRLRDERKDTCTRPVSLFYDEADKLGTLFDLSVGVSTFRTSKIRYIFGYQNRNLMVEQYGENRWSAIERLPATTLTFPAGLKNEAAAEVSKWLGEKEYVVRGSGRSQRNFLGMPWANDTRRTDNISLVKKPVATQSEVLSWPRHLGIVQFKSSLPPIIVPMVAVNMKQATFTGRDGKRFTRDNSAVYDAWTTIVGDLSPEEHAQDIAGIIQGYLGGSKPEEVQTLSDQFVEWVTTIIEQGAEISVRNRETSVNFKSLSAELRKPELIVAFVENQWLKMKDHLLLSPEDWTWISFAPEGMKIIGAVGRAQLSRIEYLGPFMQEQREIAKKDPHLAVRQEEQLMLPLEAVQNTLERLIRRGNAELSTRVVMEIRERIVALLEVISDQGVQMCVIPMSVDFPMLIKQATAEVQADEEALPRSAFPLDVMGEIIADQAAESGQPDPFAPEHDPPAQAKAPEQPKRRGNLRHQKLISPTDLPPLDEVAEGVLHREETQVPHPHMEPDLPVPPEEPDDPDEEDFQW